MTVTLFRRITIMLLTVIVILQYKWNLCKTENICRIIFLALVLGRITSWFPSSNHGRKFSWSVFYLQRSSYFFTLVIQVIMFLNLYLSSISLIAQLLYFKKCNINLFLHNILRILVINFAILLFLKVNFLCNYPFYFL